MIEFLENLKTEDFSYCLPEEKIAKFPLQQRDNSKLLFYKDKQIFDNNFSDIPNLLPQESILILNNTRVIQARILFEKHTGAKIEVFCLEPLDYSGDYSLALNKSKSCRWKCFVGNLKKWSEEIFTKFVIDNQEVILYAHIISKENGAINVNFRWLPEKLSFATILEKVGNTPLPPYIKRNSTEEDKISYQTVYSNYLGSVAAPTAGLHFTNKIFENLENRNIKTFYITLHVGAGTFKPITSSIISEHTMHSEHFYISKKLIEYLHSNIDKKIISVGTTTVRTLESLIPIAYKIKNGFSKDIFNILQWESYKNENLSITKEESLDIILKYMYSNNIEHIEAKTAIMIVPGYKFRFIDGLITNFHQPNSTLILLVASIVGENWTNIYSHALKHNYRFLSYGDSSLLIR